MVCTFSPPGVSKARAKSRRASARRAGCRPSDPRPMARSSASSSSAIQLPSVSNTRLAMLAAAALVKVRQRIFSGSTPASSRLTTRCAKTWVLPDPALAATQADTPGSQTSFCRRRTSAGMTSGDLIGGLSWHAQKIVIGAAGGRPFLDPRKMVVIAVARLPHRMHQGTIGLLVVVEAADQGGELLQRPVGLGVRRAFFEPDRQEFAGRRSALERHVGQLRDRTARRDRERGRFESPAPQHRRFQRQLRRKAGADFLFLAYRAGLVIEDHIAAAGFALDAVGNAAQPEAALAQRNLNFAADLGGDQGKIR